MEVLYEPPQEGFADSFALHDKDPQVERADSLAMLLGMQRVRAYMNHTLRG